MVSLLFIGVTMSENITDKNYYTPLPGIFAGLLQRTINSQLESDAEAAELIKALGGRVLAIELQGTGINLFFHADKAELVVSAEHSGEVATWIRGTPAALFGMAKPDMAKPDWVNTDSKVIIEGDASLVRDFESLMKRLDFDWEEKVSSILGDVVAHQLGQAARTLSGFAKKISELGRDAGRSGLQDIAAKQAGNFTSRSDFSEFRQAVESLDEKTVQLEKQMSDQVVKG